MAHKWRSNLFNNFFINGSIENFDHPSNTLQTKLNYITMECPFTEVISMKSSKSIVRYIIRVNEHQLISCLDDGTLVLWNFLTLEKIFSTDTLCLGLTAAYQPSYWHSTNTDCFLLTATPSYIFMWQIQAKGIMLIGKFFGHNGTIRSMIIIESHNDGLLCAAGTNVSIWNRNGLLLQTIERPQESSYLHKIIYLSGPGRCLLIANSAHHLFEAFEFNDNYLHKVEIPSIYSNSQLHCENISQLVEVSRTTFATGAEDGSIVFWTIDLIPIVIFNKKENYFYEISEFVTVEIQGVKNDCPIKCKSFPYSISCLVVLQQRYIIAGVGNSIKIYDTKLTKKEALIDVSPGHHSSSITCFCLVRDDTILVSGADDGSLRMWTTINKGKLATWVCLQPIDQCLNNIYFPELLLIGEILIHSESVTAICDLFPKGFASCGERHTYIYQDALYLENKEYDSIRIKLGISDAHSNYLAITSPK